jgi:hypothetical protein
MNARRGRDVADLSPGTVLVAGSTGWRYRVQAADQEADRVVLRGPYGSLSVGYNELQRGIANGRIGVRT